MLCERTCREGLCEMNVLFNKVTSHAAGTDFRRLGRL